MIRRIFGGGLAAALVITALAGSVVLAGNGNNAGSSGKTTLDAEVGWDVGSGQFDGEFITAEKQGIIIALRAQERFVGPLPVTGDRGDRVGVYEAATGDTGGNNATWNYDWSVDLSGAKGNANGRVLTDYRLVLEQDFTSESVFGLGSDPIVLSTAGYAACADAVLENHRCQQSWNPGFGNDDFDPDVEATYHLRLVLTPETFNGPAIAVAIQVNVTD